LVDKESLSAEHQARHAEREKQGPPHDSRGLHGRTGDQRALSALGASTLKRWAHCVENAERADWRVARRDASRPDVLSRCGLPRPAGAARCVNPVVARLERSHAIAYISAASSPARRTVCLWRSR
jgi:hypothetical protein